MWGRHGAHAPSSKILCSTRIASIMIRRLARSNRCRPTRRRSMFWIRRQTNLWSPTSFARRLLAPSVFPAARGSSWPKAVLWATASGAWGNRIVRRFTRWMGTRHLSIQQRLEKEFGETRSHHWPSRMSSEPTSHLTITNSTIVTTSSWVMPPRSPKSVRRISKWTFAFERHRVPVQLRIQWMSRNSRSRWVYRKWKTRRNTPSIRISLRISSPSIVRPDGRKMKRISRVPIKLWYSTERAMTCGLQLEISNRVFRCRIHRYSKTASSWIMWRFSLWNMSRRSIMLENQFSSRCLRKRPTSIMTSSFKERVLRSRYLFWTTSMTRILIILILRNSCVIAVLKSQMQNPWTIARIAWKKTLSRYILTYRVINNTFLLVRHHYQASLIVL